MKNRTGTVVFYILCFLVAAVAAVFFGHAISGPKDNADNRTQVVFAVPENRYVTDWDSNYYTKWLEEKTGYKIVFVTFPEGKQDIYINDIIKNKSSAADGILLNGVTDGQTIETLSDYVKTGDILLPKNILPEDSNLSGLTERFPEADFTDIKTEDGSLFCFPSIDSSRSNSVAQILWLDSERLKKAGCSVPKTEEEFEDMLYLTGDEALFEEDAEISTLSIIYTSDFPEMDSRAFFLNCYGNYGISPFNALNKESPAEELMSDPRYAQGFAKLNELTPWLFYDMYSDFSFYRYERKEIQDLINDPAGLVLGFTTDNIGNIVYRSNPEVIMRYVPVAPLSPSEGVNGYAIPANRKPAVGGVVLKGAKHAKEVAEIMDLMLSEEASLIMTYGEEFSDWERSAGDELSPFGTKARITSIHCLKDIKQNKNFAGTGPSALSASLLDDVCYCDERSLADIVNAKAVLLYEPYLPK